MKKRLVMMWLTILGLDALLTESPATMLAGTRLDRLTQTTGTSAWYAAQAIPGFDNVAVAASDPRDPATEGMNYGAASYWFEYRTVPGKTFDCVDVCLAVFDAGGSGLYNGIALSYSTDGVTYTNLPPTTAETYFDGGAGWSLCGRQYDLQGLNATHVRVTKYANATYTWSTAVSSVYLEVSPATMLAGTHLDYMTQATGTSAWYAAQAIPGFDNVAVAARDPRDPATEVMNYGAATYWFEYKAVPGKTFDYVDVGLAIFDAGGSGFYNGIALSYSTDGVTYTNLPPTTAETYADGGAGWSLCGRRYDLHGLNATHVKLIKYANDTYTWSTAISSVYLELVPDTTIADDVNWKELRSTMEMVPGSILDFYRPEEAPAGKYGFLRVVDDHFEFEQRPGNAVRFYGANLCFTGVFMNHGDADHMADHLAWCGYNAVRLHHFDELLTLNMSNSTEFDPARLDEMDYLVAALKQRGIYITLDFYTLRPIPQSELTGVNVSQIRDEVKLLTYVNDSVRDNMYTFAANLMNHVNPYTGLAWKDEPAITHISLLNENTLFDLLNLLPETKRQYELAFQNSPAGQVSYASDEDKERARRTFYTAIFKTGFQDFQNYLRTLGVRVPLTDFNCGNSGLVYPIRETRDYVDNHFYFDHPVFLGSNWALPYQISNRSSMDLLIEPLTETASSRIFGKPFTITEWNFCFPNSYAVEGAFLTGAYAALQDWSGIYRFCYTDKKDNINGAGAFELTMFDVVDDPVRLLSERAGVCFFRRGDIRAATPCFPSAISRDLAELPDPDFRMGDSARLGMFLGRIGATVGTATSAVPLNSAAVVPLDSGMAARQWPVPVLNKTLTGKDFLAALAQQSGLGARCFQPEPLRLTSDTGELVLEPDAEKFTVATPYSEGVLLKGGGTADLPFLQIANRSGFAAFLAAATDGKPLPESKRILLLHLTESKNDGMEFSDCHRQVVNVLGKVPVLIRRGNAEVTLKQPLAGFRLYAVDLTGKRTFEVPLKAAGTNRVFDADTFAAAGVTLAYELVGDESSSVVVTFDAAGGTVDPASQTVYDSFAYGTLPVPTRAGYLFGGWWTGENGTGSEVTADTIVATATDHTLYAKWTAGISPAPSTVALAAASDTGVSATDGLTRLNNHAPAAALSFMVNGTVAGAGVRLYADGTQIGSAVAGGTTTTVLTNGVTALADGAHAITATQAVAGTDESAATPALTVTVDTTAPTLLTAVSRKIHGTAGTFDLTLPISAPWGIECRMADSSILNLVFGFNEAVHMGTGSTAAVTAGTAIPGTFAATGASIDLCLVGVANVQWLKLRLNPIEDQAGNALDLAYTIGILAGDSTLNGSVNAQDILFVRQNSGHPLNQGTNFRYDLNASGTVNAQDVLFVRSYSGNTLPPQ